MNLYKRGTVWWARIVVDGREVRFSTRSREIETARQICDHWIEAHRNLQVDGEWKAVVSAWRDDAHSWLNRAYRHMRTKSRKRDWPSMMHYEELVTLALLSEGRCQLTGLRFDRASNGKHAAFAISIDRIDSAKGYTVENCRLICLIANFAMRQWGEDALRKLALAYVTQLAEGIKTGTCQQYESLSD